MSEAIELLEDARVESKYSTIPFQAIKAKVGSKAKSGGMYGEHYDCWAVHMNTGKKIECVVVANSGEGAKEQMQKYLRIICDVDPSIYALFIGKENNLAFHRYRSSVLNQSGGE